MIHLELWFANHVGINALLVIW